MKPKLPSKRLRSDFDALESCSAVNADSTKYLSNEHDIIKIPTMPFHSVTYHLIA